MKFLHASDMGLARGDSLGPGMAHGQLRFQQAYRRKKQRLHVRGSSLINEPLAARELLPGNLGPLLEQVLQLLGRCCSRSLLSNDANAGPEKTNNEHERG